MHPDDAAARAALCRIDLSPYLDAVLELYCYGYTADDGKMPVEIYVGGEALTTARWPDASERDAYVYTAEKDVVTTAAGSKTIFYGDKIAEGWFLWLYDRNPDHLHESVQKMQEVDFDSELWREHYAGTIWENLYDYASSDRIGQVRGMGDKELRNEAAKSAPKDSNEVNGNLFVSIPHVTSGGSCNFHDNLEADPSIFRDPENGDWTLTEEGLRLAEESCPGFEALPFSSMGREGD